MGKLSNLSLSSTKTKNWLRTKKKPSFTDLLEVCALISTNTKTICFWLELKRERFIFAQRLTLVNILRHMKVTILLCTLLNGITITQEFSFHAQLTGPLKCGTPPSSVLLQPLTCNAPWEMSSGHLTAPPFSQQSPIMVCSAS